MSFMNKLGRVAQAIGNETGKAIEVGRLKVKIQAEKAEIEKIKTKMGNLVWQNYEAGEAQSSELTALCEQIEDSLAAIDILHTAIETVRQQDVPDPANQCCCRCDDQPQQTHCCQQEAEAPEADTAEALAEDLAEEAEEDVQL